MEEEDTKHIGVGSGDGRRTVDWRCGYRGSGGDGSWSGSGGGRRNGGGRYEEYRVGVAAVVRG